MNKLLSEATEMELVNELAKKFAKKKLFMENSEFTFILLNEEEFQIIMKDDLPTNYLIHD